MAIKYARSGGGTWTTDSTWSTTSGGTADTTAPTAADDAVLDASSGNVSIAGNSYCRSADFTGYTGTFTFPGSTYWYVGDATSGANDYAIKMNGTMTISVGSSTSSRLRFESTSSTPQKIDFAGQNLGSCWMVDGCSYVLAGNWGTISNYGFLYWSGAGTFDLDTYTMYCSRISASGPATLDMGSGELHVKYSGAALTSSHVDFTIVAGTGTVVLRTDYSSGCGIVLAAAQTIYRVENVSTGTGGSFLKNVTVTELDIQKGRLTLYSDITVTSSFNLEGDSSVRAKLLSDVFGVPRTITNTGATITTSYSAIQDTTMGTTYDASSKTGWCLDLGGNTNIIFDTATDWYWYNSTGGTYDFSDYTHWYTATNGGGSQMGSSRTPFTQDTCYIDANSITGTTTITMNMLDYPELDTTGSGTVSLAVPLTKNFYGSLYLKDGATFDTSALSRTLNFYPSSTAELSAISNSYISINIYSRSTTTLTGDLNISSFYIYNTYGTTDFNDYNITCTSFNINSTTGGAIPTVYWGSGTVQANLVSNGSCNLPYAGFTSYPETSLFRISNTTGTGCYLRQNICTLGDVYLDLDGGYINIEDGGTMSTLTIDPTGATQDARFEGNKTHNITSLVAVGDATHAINLRGTATTIWTISDASGTNSVSYCSITDSTATGGADWLAYTTNGNTDNGDNTGWVFTAPVGTPSASPSSTPSSTSSESPSTSPSATPSSTPSASPSAGYERYSRGSYVALPTGIDDLTTSFSAQDYLDVNAFDGTRVGQDSTGQYAIKQFKDYIGAVTEASFTWKGRSSLAPSVSEGVLQIYNFTSTTWETLDSNTTASADTDFILSDTILDMTNYKSDGLCVCRVYQLGV